MKFTLEPDELSTPEGLQQACRRAREYVEKNIPGDHQPGPGRWYVRDPDGSVKGCACAIGYLGTALAGSVSAGCERNPQLGQDLLEYGLPSSYVLSQFECGFDRGSVPETNFDRDNLHLAEWFHAGHTLGREWHNEMEGTQQIL